MAGRCFQGNKVWLGSLIEGTPRVAIRDWLYNEGLWKHVCDMHVKNVPGSDGYAFIDFDSENASLCVNNWSFFLASSILKKNVTYCVRSTLTNYVIDN